MARTSSPSGTIKFTLADVTAPTIINTTTNGRIVTIDFSKALDPATVTLSDIFVIRQGAMPTWPPTQADVLQYSDLNSDPRARISYQVVTNPTTGALSYVVTLDYSPLPQTEMPSDKYAIVALSTPGGSGGVTDLVGNPLNGSFSGSFPSGSTGTPLDFIENLGQQNVVAPTITSFQVNPTPTNDTGIVGDQNTNISEPVLIGQLYAAFPGTVANLPVYIQFSGLHNGAITLAPGIGGRGFTGTPDVQVTTNSVGTFTVTPPGPCRKVSRRPRPWWSVNPTRRRCPVIRMATSTTSASTRRRPRSPGPRLHPAAHTCLYRTVRSRIPRISPRSRASSSTSLTRSIPRIRSIRNSTHRPW